MNDDKLMENKFDKNTHKICQERLKDLRFKFKSINKLSRAMRIADKSITNIIEFNSKQKTKIESVFLSE